MFGLGPMELAVILVLALLVMGPKRIPELASNLGRAIRSFRRATRELRDQIEIDEEVRRPFEELRSALRDEPPPFRYDFMTPPDPSPRADSSAQGPAAAEPAPLQDPPGSQASAAGNMDQGGSRGTPP
ncbi:MAG: twin-arginine translocase TatA/TatE family subunit [Myxococcales bacterium]|nr:twin-arginine translocase TatA/TatE family subunit [Myxococcota bacterium]MDW8284204.1 twin-arginine translocase TatA/TatE family subunit [Myxococcales bacterium]